MAALGLPIALALGALAAVAAGLLLRLVRGEGPWGSPVVRLWHDLRRARRTRRDRPLFLEVAAAGAALLGSGLAAAAAVGFVPGSFFVVYPALVVAAAGAHAAASAPSARAADDRVRVGRLPAAIAEPAFLLSVGAVFLRWRATDLEGVRGAQEVLGPGVTVGPPLALWGLLVASAVMVVAGALRAPPPIEAVRGPGRPAVSGVLVALCRWALVGATALLVATVLVGGAGGLSTETWRVVAAAALAAVVAGVVDASVRLFPRGALIASGAMVFPAAVAMVLVTAA